MFRFKQFAHEMFPNCFKTNQAQDDWKTRNTMPYTSMSDDRFGQVKTMGTIDTVIEGRQSSFRQTIKSVKTPVHCDSRKSKKTKNKVDSVTHISRNSVAVVECPIPSLCKNEKESSDEENDCSVRPSIAIPIERNASVSALEVLPASPDREKLIEIYIINDYVVKYASADSQILKHLIKFMEEVEKDSIKIYAGCTPLDEDLVGKLRIDSCYSKDLVKEFIRHHQIINIVGLYDGPQYLSRAVDLIHGIKARNGDNNGVTIAVSDCCKTHCEALVEDINGINVMVPMAFTRENSLTKPRGVPVIAIDQESIGHITIGFDSYGQYEIRRTEHIKYNDYLKELGLLDFLEEDESNMSAFDCYDW